MQPDIEGGTPCKKCAESKIETAKIFMLLIEKIHWLFY